MRFATVIKGRGGQQLGGGNSSLTASTMQTNLNQLCPSFWLTNCQLISAIFEIFINGVGGLFAVAHRRDHGAFVVGDVAAGEDAR